MHGPGRTLAALVAALGLTFSLAACGGGGGGGGGGMPPTATNPTPAPTEQEPSTPAPEAKPTPAPETPAPTARTEADRNRAAGTDPERTFRSARAVTDALPRFGSVTQSTNVGADSITSDRASFDANSQRLRVTITREGKDPLILDSNDAFYDSDPGGDDTSDGIGTRLWDTARGTDSGLTVSNISAGWFTDAVRAAAFRNTWRAEGYWLHWAGRNLLSSAPTVTGIEMGAFIDGPEYRSPPESLPVRGTARYEGSANGFVVLEYGTRFASGRPEGTVVGADWRGTTTLTADFADNSISGCIGCTGNIRLTEWLVPDGVQRRPAGTEISTRIHLGRTSVGADGTFRGATVTLSDPDASAYPLTSSSGAWGGKFSNIPYSGTVLPPKVAGTVGGKAAWSDGSHAAYVGTFSGLTSPDERTP